MEEVLNVAGNPILEATQLCSGFLNKEGLVCVGKCVNCMPELRGRAELTTSV